MAIKLKQKVKQTEKQDDLSEFAADIDEIGALVEEADVLEAGLSKAVKEKLGKIAALRKDAKAKTKALATKITEAKSEEGVDDEQPVVEPGTQFNAEMGKRGTLRTITDMPMIKQLMDDQDDELFMKLVKMNIGDVDAYLTPEERDMVLETELQDRSIKIVKRAI